MVNKKDNKYIISLAMKLCFFYNENIYGCTIQLYVD